MNIFFDVQGTLLTEDSDPRPRVRECFLKLSDMGHHVYLWSTAGDGYAVHAARVLEVDDVVRGCFGKRSVPEDITVDFAVDDQPSWVEEHGGFLVKAYDGDPWDQELLGVVEAVEALGLHKDDRHVRSLHLDPVVRERGSMRARPPVLAQNLGARGRAQPAAQRPGGVPAGL